MINGEDQRIVTQSTFSRAKGGLDITNWDVRKVTGHSVHVLLMKLRVDVGWGSSASKKGGKEGLAPN